MNNCVLGSIMSLLNEEPQSWMLAYDKRVNACKGRNNKGNSRKDKH